MTTQISGAKGGGHIDGFCERVINAEKTMALLDLRLGALEKGAHLEMILHDMSEIKGLIKGVGDNKGLMAKVDAVEETQQKMIWLLAGFALCVPTVVSVFLAIFPKFYDIHFTPLAPKPALIKPIQ